MVPGQSAAAQAPRRGGLLVTIGEALGLLTARGPGPLASGSKLTLGVAGAELNVAIGVARLGGRAAWVGRVGDDEFGRLIRTTLEHERVDVSALLVDPARPTSLLVRGTSEGGARWAGHYRVEGPGARLQASDVPGDTIASASVLHVTGITPALSPSARVTVGETMRRARSAGATVTFDVNYRPALWGAETARPVLEELIGLADHAFVGADEAEAVGWGGDAQALGARLGSLGPGVVVVKRAGEGATALAAGEAHRVRAVPTECVDLHGAGDAFAAGYIAELMRGAPLSARLTTAAECAACVIGRPGDWEGLPRRAQLGASGQRTTAR